MDLAKLVTLKDLLVNSKNLSELWTYFFDHFGNNPEFLGIGERTRAPLLEGILTQTLKQACKLTIDPEAMILTRVPNSDFIHGGYLGGSKMVNVIYFEELHAGSIVVAAMGDTKTMMMRFTAQSATKPTKPSMN